MDIRRGSGTFVGIRVLADALQALGHEVAIETPTLHLPVYTLERIAFNRKLRAKPGFDLTVGFDLDGYSLPADARHVVSLKGVIAQEKLPDPRVRPERLSLADFIALSKL